MLKAVQSAPEGDRAMGAGIVDLIGNREIPWASDLSHGITTATHQRDITEYIRSGIIKPDRIQDIMIMGGNNREVGALDQVFPGRNMAVVNLHERMLASIDAERKHLTARELKLYRADGSRLPADIFPDGSYDFFYMDGINFSTFKGYTFETERIVDKIVQRAVRLVRPGGYILDGSGIINMPSYGELIRKGYVTHDRFEPNLYVRTDKAIDPADFAPGTAMSAPGGINLNAAMSADTQNEASMPADNLHHPGDDGGAILGFEPVLIGIRTVENLPELLGISRSP